MKLTAEEIIQIIKDEMKWISESMDEVRAQIAAYDPMKPMNNREYNCLAKWYRHLQDGHNHIINLQTVLNHIEAAEEEKHTNNQSSSEVENAKTY